MDFFKELDAWKENISLHFDFFLGYDETKRKKREHLFCK